MLKGAKVALDGFRLRDTNRCHFHHKKHMYATSRLTLHLHRLIACALNWLANCGKQEHHDCKNHDVTQIETEYCMHDTLLNLGKCT